MPLLELRNGVAGSPRGIAPSGLPQIRTCAFDTSGSSSQDFAALLIRRGYWVSLHAAILAAPEAHENAVAPRYHGLSPLHGLTPESNGCFEPACQPGGDIARTRTCGPTASLATPAEHVERMGSSPRCRSVRGALWTGHRVDSLARPSQRGDLRFRPLIPRRKPIGSSSRKAERRQRAPSKNPRSSGSLATR